MVVESQTDQLQHFCCEGFADLESTHEFFALRAFTGTEQKLLPNHVAGGFVQQLPRNPTRALIMVKCFPQSD